MSASDLAAHRATQRTLNGACTWPAIIGELAYDAGIIMRLRVVPNALRRHRFNTMQSIRDLVCGNYTPASARVMVDELVRAGLDISCRARRSATGRLYSKFSDYVANLTRHSLNSGHLIRELLRNIDGKGYAPPHVVSASCGSMYIMMKDLQGSSDPVSKFREYSRRNSNMSASYMWFYRLNVDLREEFVATLMQQPTMHSAAMIVDAFCCDADPTCLTLAVGHCVELANWEEIRREILSPMPHSASDEDMRTFDTLVAIGSGAPASRKASFEYIHARIVGGELGTMKSGILGLYVSCARLCPALLAIAEMWSECLDTRLYRTGSVTITLIRRLLTEPLLDDIDGVMIPGYADNADNANCEVLIEPAYEEIVDVCERMSDRCADAARAMIGDAIYEMCDGAPPAAEPLTLSADLLKDLLEWSPAADVLFMIKRELPLDKDMPISAYLQIFASGNFSPPALAIEFCMTYEVRFADILTLTASHMGMKLARANYVGAVVAGCIDPATLRDSLRHTISSARSRLRRTKTPNLLDDWLQRVTVPVV